MALSSRCLLRGFTNAERIRTLLSPQSRCVTLAPRKVEPPSSESHDSRNARLLRPQSPHLTIYKFQLTAVLSISHRFTGMALSAYVYGAGVISLTSSKSLPQLITSLQGLDPALVYSAKFLIAFPFAYHFMNGIRHLVWDTGRALTIKGVYTTGYIMLGLTTALTFILCSL